ncbi:single-stranded DNA-binding protein [Streptomyces caniferus]|uniref:single-stranded DNA-binding protein n=1 Tax=Streptomyces caniferus TaxID=285557 RepID=UPI003F4D2B73
MVTLVGNAATAVEHRQTTAGVTVARFRLAASSRRWDRAQERWTDGGTSFYTVRSWRALADNVAASVAVGEPLVVQGRLRLREGEQPPERGGQRWFSAEVDAVAIGHDLARGTSAFRRVARPARTEADRAGHGPSPLPPPPGPRSSPAPRPAAAEQQPDALERPGTLERPGALKQPGALEEQPDASGPPSGTWEQQGAGEGLVPVGKPARSSAEPPAPGETPTPPNARATLNAPVQADVQPPPKGPPPAKEAAQAQRQAPANESAHAQKPVPAKEPAPAKRPAPAGKQTRASRPAPAKKRSTAAISPPVEVPDAAVPATPAGPQSPQKAAVP